MTSSVKSPTDIINLSLAVIGYSGRVGNLYDGSAAAKKALDIYAETRDEVLRMKDWPFALRQVAGAGGVSTPIAGWSFSWAYPADCLRVRSVSPNVFPSPDFDPQPVLWAIYNDRTQTPPVRSILTQINSIFINYVGQITDPASWEPLFVDALVQALAVKLAPFVRKDLAPALNPEGAVARATTADDMLAPDDAMRPQVPQPVEARRA